MSAATRYASFPKTIFGLRCTQHRVKKVIQVLRYYKKQREAKSTKLRTLSLLVTLEKQVGDQDREVICEWLSSEKPSEGFIRKLNEIRGMKQNSEDEPTMNDVISLPPEKECSVCMEFFGLPSFPAQKLTISCQHEPTTCHACVTQSINTQIPEVEWDQVECPECPETLSFDTIKDWASNKAFKIYDRKALMSVFKDVPNFTMCLGPSCGSGQIHDGGDDQPIMTCEACKFKTCYIHKMPWHTDQTCADYDAEQQKRIEQETASAQLIAKTTTLCANHKCRAPIEKHGGCDHMTCCKCKHQFCFICAAPWITIQRIGNSAHNRKCKYHSNNLPVWRVPT